MASIRKVKKAAKAARQRLRLREYILRDRKPVECRDLLAWAHWFEDVRNRRVAQTIVGPYWISTVFLGLDHSFGRGEPLFFETMVFIDPAWGGDHADLEMDRYSTWEEAELGHAALVAHYVALDREAMGSTGGALVKI